MTKAKDERFSEKETQERFEAALRGALKTPHERKAEVTRGATASRASEETGAQAAIALA